MIYNWAALVGRLYRILLAVLFLSLLATGVSVSVAQAAPYAAHLMDARTGETLYEENAETRLHPASLTKMMTLYIAFQEIEAGNLSLDSMITVSKNAAAQPPSRLGLKAGQKIQLRYLIRAAAVKSANDAAAAIGDAIGGTTADFGTRMTRTAKSLGMRNSTFKNANGLTAKGHLSTAKDMSILGRHLFYDFPQYYNIFSRRSTDAGLATVASTNRKFLDGYRGADGIKTGYTGPAGFNLTASAERDGVRLIATVFGAVSTPDRNARVSKLLDKGFAMVKGGGGPAPVLRNADDELLASAAVPEEEGPANGAESPAKTIRVVMTVKSSPRPMARPDMSELSDGAEVVVAAMADDIAGALAEATGIAAETGTSTETGTAAELPFAVAQDVPVQPTVKPAQRPETVLASAQSTPPAVATKTQDLAAADVPKSDAPQSETPIPQAQDLPKPGPVMAASLLAAPKRNAPIYEDAPILASAAPAATETVTRLSTSGENHFGINVGRFKSADSAERILLKMQLVESATLAGSLRKVSEKGGGYDANFLGLSQEAAELACRRLTARSIPCLTLAP